MSTVTKKELTDRIADSIKVRRVLVKDIVQRFLDEITRELARSNRLEFRDFGVFEVRTRRPRMAQNPRTLQRVPVPVKKTVRFKVGRMMRDRVQDDKPLPDRGGQAVEVPTVSETPPSPPGP